MFDRRDFIARFLIATSAGVVAVGTSHLNGQDKTTDKKEKPAARPQLDSKMVKNFVAFSHGNFKGVKELIAKEPQLINASWDWINGDWETGLGAASHVGNRDIAEFLLDKGARINVFAMTMLGHTDMVKIILKTYPKTHAVRGPHGIPLLSHAIYGREQAADVFALLLENGVGVNQASNAGQTPLMAAASLGRVEVLQPLLDHKANPNLTDKKGRTALEYARGRKREKAATILEKVTKH